ncbi:MAG: alpha/beta hydrolase [Pseudomonadota bacterium]
MRLAASLILLLLLGVAVVQWRAAAREASARAAFPAEGVFVEVDGRRVHAVQMGAGPDVVLIHGSSGNLRDYTFALAPALAKKYRVTVFDRPGLGWSDRLEPGAEGSGAQGRHLKQAADALGVEMPVVLGQSYGAAVALAWVLDHPGETRAMVSVAGPSHLWEGPLPFVYQINSSWFGSRFIVPILTGFVPDSYLQRSIEGVFAPQAVPEGYSAALGAELALTRTALRANAAQRASLKGEIAKLVPRYGGFPVPLEIVHGDADTLVSVEIHGKLMVKDTDKARLTTLEGIGHTPHHVAVEAVAAAVDRAFERGGR